MKEKTLISQFCFQKILKEIKNQEQKVYLLRKKLDEVTVVDNCLKCNGKGEVPVGNIYSVYGFRLGDNGFVECLNCNGKGYK